MSKKSILGKTLVALPLTALLFVASKATSQTVAAQAGNAPVSATASTKGTNKSGEKAVDFIVQINVAASFDPKEAVGLLISSSGVIEKPAINILKVKDGMSVVSFGYAKSEVKKDTYASAMLLSATGEAAFGDIRSVQGLGSKTSFYSIPSCPADRLSKNLDSSKLGTFEAIVNFRIDRRGTYRKEVADIMSGTFLQDLQKLERGFGLTRGKQISSELSPIELVERLSRISTTLQALSEKDKKRR